MSMGPNEEQEYAARVSGTKRRTRPTVAAQGSTVNIERDTPVEKLAREMGGEQIREVGRIGTHREQRRERDRDRGEQTASAPATPSTRSTPGPAVTPDAAQQTLFSRRAHSKGDGNLPAAEPHAELIDERPRDRTPLDLPKERDDRSAPKGNVTRGQAERNPSLEARDDYEPELPPSKSGYERAGAAADHAVRPRRPASGARPNARRSSSAKRKVTTRMDPSRGRAKTNVRQAPKSASRSGRRAAVARKPQIGTRRTGTAPRGDAVSRRARGNVGARKAAKASRASAKERREREAPLG